MRPLKILIATDSFKGSLTSLEAGEAIRRGLAEGLAGLGVPAGFVVIPIADGGEGTVAAFHAATGGELVSVPCRDPLGGQVRAEFLLLADRQTAIIEMAASSGLPLVAGRADILHSDTYGLGQQILAAVERGSRNILIGIGGSATNDGGAGMARALGVRFRDAAGRDLGTTPTELERVQSVDISALDPRLKQVHFQAMCDVDNPLLGPTGAAPVYAPQKGADAPAVARLEAIGRHYADAVEQALGARMRHLPGTGAAGGLGFGLCAFLAAKLSPGIQVVLEVTALRRVAAECDLLITGEGRLDAQSARGKAPMGVAAVASELGVPCVAFCGSAAGSEPALTPKPFAAVYQIVSVTDSVAEGIARATVHLQTLARVHAGELAALAARRKNR